MALDDGLETSLESRELGQAHGHQDTDSGRWFEDTPESVRPIGNVASSLDHCVHHLGFCAPMQGMTGRAFDALTSSQLEVAYNLRPRRPIALQRQVGPFWLRSCESHTLVVPFEWLSQRQGKRHVNPLNRAVLPLELAFPTWESGKSRTKGAA